MNEQTFVEQVKVHERTLYRTAYSMTRNDHDALDAVQNALTKAWIHRHKVNPAAFRAWLLRIVINECHSIRRKTKRETLVEEVEPVQVQPPPDSLLRIALDRLPDNLRLPILLHYMEGFSIKEIAMMLRIPAGTVTWRMSKARILLKEELSEKGAILHGGF